jgi:DNA-binding LytR/AlgR family response regulator
MNSLLKTVIVDDSPFDSTVLKDLLENSELIHVSHVFNNPKEFIDKAPTLDMDLCLLDIVMPEMDGLTVAQLLGGKPIIFVTGVDTQLRGALSLNPIDIITKPLNKGRLDQSVEKAYKLLRNTKEYGVFSMAESKRKVKIHLPDIILVTTDEIDPRHKIVLMNNGIKHTVMECSLDTLLNLCPNLVQVNKAELVSLEAINEVQHDRISINCHGEKTNKPKEVTLSRAYKDGFRKRVFFNENHHKRSDSNHL